MVGGALAGMRPLAEAESSSSPGALLVFLVFFVLVFGAVAQFMVRCVAAYRRVRRASRDGDDAMDAAERAFVFGGSVMAGQTGSTTYVFAGASPSVLAVEEVQVLSTTRVSIQRDHVEHLRWSRDGRSVSLAVESDGTSSELVKHPSVASLVSVLDKQGWPIEPAGT